ncbi:MAG: biotin synthase BioB [Eubacterium sp.]|nr:biotin synthase BioB [Eubacterium sp.]
MKLANEIIAGRRLGRDDDLSFFETTPVDELCEGANHIRMRLCGNHIDLCTIINGRAGRCFENCKFCAQSAHHHTACNEYEMLTPREFLHDCLAKDAAKVHAYSIVTAGRTVEGDDFDTLLESYRLMHKHTDMRLCASHGLLEQDAFFELKKAGVSMYHSNIETSRRFFPEICTTHTFEDKLTEIARAKTAGLEVCSGGIIGMGETFADRVDMALTLAELEITSIPINVLMPVPGTPLGHNKPLSNEEVLRTLTMFRYVNPTAYIRIAAGRGQFPDGGRKLFTSGVNATITGDMLTTVGNNMSQDREMLSGMGFDIERIKN